MYLEGVVKLDQYEKKKCKTANILCSSFPLYSYSNKNEYISKIKRHIAKDDEVHLLNLRIV